MSVEIMTIKEVGAFRKIPEKTANKRTAEGKITAFAVRGFRRFGRSELEQLIEQ